MKKGQEPGQLDKEAVGRITCRILQEEEPGGMLVKKLWRLAGMLICLLASPVVFAALSHVALEPIFGPCFLDTSDCLGAVLDRVFQTAPGRGISAPCNFGNPDRRKPFPAAAAKDVIAGYMSAVNGVRSRLNEAYDGTLALYQVSASAMQMTVFFGFILFLLAGAVICRDLLSDQSGSGSGRRISGAGRDRNCRRDTPLFQLFSDPVGNPWNAQCRRRQSGGSKGSGQCPSSKADDRADEKQCQCLPAFAGC